MRTASNPLFSFVLVLLLMCGPASVAAAAPGQGVSVRGQVLDARGQGAMHAAVLLEPTTTPPTDGRPPADRSAAQPARIEQVWLSFVPKIQLVSVGTTLTISNRDDESHTVHAWLHGATLFNRAAVPDDPEQHLRLDEPGLVTITCDLHAEMRALIVVTQLEHTALTDEQGRFTIEGVPSGRYHIRVAYDQREEQNPRAAPRGEPGLPLTTVALAATTPELVLTLPPLAPSAGSSKTRTDQPPARPPDNTRRIATPVRYFVPLWPRGIWVYLTAVLGLGLGMALAYFNLRLALRHGFSRVSALLVGCGIAMLSGALVVVGLHPGVAAAIGFGSFVGSVIFGAVELSPQPPPPTRPPMPRNHPPQRKRP